MILPAPLSKLPRGTYILVSSHMQDVEDYRLSRYRSTAVSVRHCWHRSQAHQPRRRGGGELCLQQNELYLFRHLIGRWRTRPVTRCTRSGGCLPGSSHSLPRRTAISKPASQPRVRGGPRHPRTKANALAVVLAHAQYHDGGRHIPSLQGKTPFDVSGDMGVGLQGAVIKRYITCLALGAPPSWMCSSYQQQGMHGVVGEDRRQGWTGLTIIDSIVGPSPMGA